jgi:hypothetical protein
VPTAAPTLAAVAEQGHSRRAGTSELAVQRVSRGPEDLGSVEFMPLIDDSYVEERAQSGPGDDFPPLNRTIIRSDESELRFSTKSLSRPASPTNANRMRVPATSHSWRQVVAASSGCKTC